MGAAGEGGGERFRSWYLSREEIERGSPSRRDGVSAAKEAELRATYCSFIRDVCLRLQLPQITFATAIMLCHRFYLRQSLARNEWQMEDTPCKLELVVTVAYETMYRKNPDAAKRIQQKVVLDKQKALILVGETLLLSTIRFDFNIQHPYEPLKIALKNLGISQKEVRQIAINLINDTLPTTLVVQFKPHYIAAGALFLAAKFHNIRLPSETGNIWWQKFDVAPNQLQAVTQQMTELFKKRNLCSMGPAIRPTPPPTPMDKRQIISTPDPTLRHTQSSRRSISNSDSVASRCVPVDNSFYNKSVGSSARNEASQSVRAHINHSLNIVAVDQRLEKQPPRGTLKAPPRATMIHEIDHAHLPIRGLNLHIAQVGSGELGTVVFLHGFPEIWYSWRHQMLAVAAAGYRAVAPDWRGYGLSDQPPPEREEEASCWDDLVADVLAILDALSVPKAFVVGKDFGALPAYYFALRHPDRTRGVVCLGMNFSPAPFSFDSMPEGFYILRWREPGRAEADFGRHDVRRVVRTVYVLFSGAEVPIAKEGQEIMDLADASTPLPEWFTEEDLDAYVSLYEKSGFQYPLRMYRALHKMPHLPDAKFEVPVFMVMGEKDYAFKLPRSEAAMMRSTMESFAPDLKMTFIPEGSHFVQEQLPEQVNELLLGFFKDHRPGGP